MSHPTRAASAPVVQATVGDEQFQDGLVFLGDYVERSPGLVKGRAVRDGAFEVEAKLRSIFGDTAPASLREGEAFDSSRMILSCAGESSRACVMMVNAKYFYGSAA